MEITFKEYTKLSPQKKKEYTKKIIPSVNWDIDMFGDVVPTNLQYRSSSICPWIDTKYFDDYKNFQYRAKPIIKKVNKGDL